MVILDCINCNTSWGVTKKDFNNTFELKCPNCNEVFWVTKEQEDLLNKKII